jgi:hypothetical protein
MIFKQYREILDGTKTQTRRVVKPGERSILNFAFEDGQTDTIDAVHNGRMKWQVGRTYDVVPGRGKHSIYYKRTSGGLSVWDSDSLPKDKRPRNLKPYLEDQGWLQLRIRITGIRQELLNDISEADAVAEGCAWDGYWTPAGVYDPPEWRGNYPPDDYADLWESINGAGSWDTNPSVWVITFELDRS